MKARLWLIGGVATAALMGGWAMAQPSGHEPGGMNGMRPGMHDGMAAMMGERMGPGMMGMGRGSATSAERRDIHDLIFNHDRIRRTVTNLPNGIRTVTESDDPRIAAIIKKHVAEMGRRVEAARDPGLPIESPALHSIFRDKDKIKSTYEVTDKGIVVVQTSTDAAAVKALQDHAVEVSDLVERGMMAAHEAMLKNGGMMGHGMRGAMAEPPRLR